MQIIMGSSAGAVERAKLGPYIDEAKRRAGLVDLVDPFNLLLDQLATVLLLDLSGPDVVDAGGTRRRLLVTTFDASNRFRDERLPVLRQAMRDAPGRLKQNAEFRAAFNLVDGDTAAGEKAMAEAARRHAVDYAGPAKPGETAPPVESYSYPPEMVYRVETQFDRVDPEDRIMRYYLFVNASGVLSRNLLLSRELSEEYRYQPFARQWVRADTDEARRKRLEQVAGAAAAHPKNSLH